MSEDELRAQYTNDIADELGQLIEEFGEHPDETEFNTRKQRRIDETTQPDTPERAALESVTWDDVRARIYG